MNREYLRQLAIEADDIEEKDPQNDVLWYENFDKRLAELTKNLDDTIEFLDTCSAQELSAFSEVFEELSEHFRSQKLIECVERNVTRFDDPALQEQLKMELGYMETSFGRKDETINREYLRQLVDEAEALDPQNEVLEEINCQKRFTELSKNLDETIAYLDTCDRLELYWATEIFEELSEHFRSQKLIECVERNVTRFDDPALQEQLKMELGYMKMNM